MRPSNVSEWRHDIITVQEQILEEHQAAESDDQLEEAPFTLMYCVQSEGYEWNHCNTELLMPKNFERRERRIAWLFLIMINNLNAGGEADMWKYVDDTTISKVVDKGQESCI